MTMPLTRLEKTIEAHRSNFYRAGRALMEIRDDALYRALLFDSFEVYVKTRWDMSKSQAYRLIEASKVMNNLSPIGDGILPANEAQVRVLSGLNESDQRRVWKGFISSGMAMSASNIRKLVKPAKPENHPVSRIDIISASFKKTVLTMLEQIRWARNDQWQTTSRQAGLYWVRVMKERIINEK